MKSAGRERRGGTIVLALVCLLATAGCRNASPPAGGEPTITGAPVTSEAPVTEPATTTTSLFPLDQDPPVVDLTYAQRALDEIGRVDAEASRILYREKRITPQYELMINAIYAGESLEESRAATQQDLSVGLAGWADPPQARIITAKKVLSSRPGCIALIADSDYRPRFNRPVAVERSIGVVLQRNIRPTAEERAINPSLWIETVAGEIAPGKDLSEVCR
jgi:hypothetical protein